MKISLAQVKPTPGMVGTNLKTHVKAGRIAAAGGSDLLLFPELSLTGYEPTQANALAFSPEDERLLPLRDLSRELRLILGVGLPIRFPAGITISSLFFLPDGSAQHYAKQILHSDEYPFFIPGASSLSLNFEEHILAPAICYESTLPQHSIRAAETGADIYLVSAAKHLRSMDAAKKHYSTVAKDMRLTVLFVNALGPADDFIACGHSAVWNQQGDLVQELDGETESLLQFDTKTGKAIAYPLYP